MQKTTGKLMDRFKGKRSQKGQVLIIVVFAMVALIALIGLVVDLGLVFIQYGRLRRAVDAAALSASLQYREGFTIDDLTKSATEFLVLNGINDPSAQVITCGMDPTLCDKNGDKDDNDPGEKRKLVRVIASTNAQLAFMPVIGFRNVGLHANAVSEAASVDVVLVIDTSESMTFDAAAGDPMRDPSQCNAADPAGLYPGDCAPFEDVKVAAADFVQQLYFPYDRVAVVNFDRHVRVDLGLDDCQVHGYTDPLACKNHTINVIRHLSVFQAGGVPGVDVGYTGETCDTAPPASGPCRAYDTTDHHYIGFDCPAYHNGGDPSSCTTTNIGGGLLEAANEFGRSFRQESLWVVILLTDGAANSSTDVTNAQPFGFCPTSTHTQPFCRDALVATRHCANPDTQARCVAEGGTWDPLNYDADDFARDMADFAAIDQKALVFTIGLGDLVVHAPQGDPNAGEELLKYAATTVGGGEYFFAPSGNQLREIFASIADKIAVRLTH